jgi:hypothetical protein
LLLTARVPGEPADYIWHVEFEYSADFVQGRLAGTIRRMLEIRPGKKQLTDLFRLRSLEVAEGPLEPGSADRRQPSVRYAVLAAMAAGTVVLWLLLRRERSRAPGE